MPEEQDWTFLYDELISSVIKPRVTYPTLTTLSSSQTSLYGLKIKKENPVPSNQSIIDDEVKAALEKPRREAEIKRRVDAVEKIGHEDNYEVGTVLKWKRKYGKDYYYTYVAIKAGDDKWYVTGSQMVNTGGWSWKSLLEWMLTGENMVEELQVSTAWETVL